MNKILCSFICFVGILSYVITFEFIIVLLILNKVLSILNVLSNQLQSKSGTLGTSSNLIQSIISTFKNQKRLFFKVL